MNATTNAPIRFTRTDHDGATETLTLVYLSAERGNLYCDEMGRETPYAVLVEQDHYSQVFDLDGDEIRPAIARDDYSLATDAPADVIEQLAYGWESGTTTVERVS